MPARLLVISLDAAEAPVLERLAAEGRLPALARQMTDGAAAKLGNPLETIPGGVWAELATGRSIGRIAQFFLPRQLHTGETTPRPVAAEELDTSLYWWTVASEAGRRLCIVDQPETVVRPGLNGIQVSEWGAHSRRFGTHSDPPGLYGELRALYGEHPVRDCDHHDRTPEGYERLRSDLLAGAAAKTELLLDLLGREDWDLFVCAYSETHCAGHQMWHLFDADHPDHDERAPVELREAVPTVYAQVDEGIGRVVAAAGPDATVLVVISHGIGPFIGGYQLLPEVLVRLGLGSGHGVAASVRTRLPRPLRAVVRRLVPGRARRRLQASAGSLASPLDEPTTRAVALHNNRCGSVRLNLRGREPFGSVEPGAEAEALLEELKRELAVLEDPDTGERIVKRVATTAEVFGPDRHPDLPDLIVVFRDDLGPLEACRSERIGVVRRTNLNPLVPRSGDHTVESRLWATGPGIEPGTTLQGGNVLDLAPTVLALLDVPAPDDLDGRPLLVPAAAE